jgi:hypothetical protein
MNAAHISVWRGTRDVRSPDGTLTLVRRLAYETAIT